MSRRLLESFKFKGIDIYLYDEDFDHAEENHPGQVTLDKIRSCITDPDKVIESLAGKNGCLFYEITSGDEYFVVVVHVKNFRDKSIGEIKTAYDSSYIKKGKVLFEKGGSK